MIVTLPLLLACTDSAGESDPGLEPELTVNPEAGTFATVTWKTDTAAPGRLEYGVDESYGETLTATDSDGGRTHTVKWFGTPAGTNPHWRVVSAGADPEASTDQVFEAPFPPTELPAFDGEVASGSESGFVLTSMLPKPVGALIVDGQNRPVWWHLLEDGREAMQTRLSADGQAVLLFETSADYTDDDSLLHRIPLDGNEGWELRLPQGHHDFRELPDGRFMYLAIVEQDLGGATVAGDALVMIDAAGATETAWSTWGTVPTDTIEPKNLYPGNYVDWTHCNSFDLDPATGYYWVSAHNLSALLVVDPALHQVRWQIGGTLSNTTLVGGGFDQQHSPFLVPGGFVLFDNGEAESDVLLSEVLEFTFDDTTGTATRTWAYEDPDGLYATFFGNAERLPGGNTLVSWGGAGRVSEVTPAGERVRRLDAGLGTALGFAHSLGAGPALQ